MTDTLDPATRTSRTERLYGWTRHALLEAGFALSLSRDDPRVAHLAAAIERAALPETPAPLDVERLARAEHNRRVSVEAECHHGRAGNDCDIVARWDAREYARLTGTPESSK